MLQIRKKRAAPVALDRKEELIKKFEITKITKFRGTGLAEVLDMLRRWGLNDTLRFPRQKHLWGVLRAAERSRGPFRKRAGESRDGCQD